MLWFSILTCATGVLCGLSEPITASVGLPTEAECLQIGNLATVLVYKERTPEFKVTCVLRPDKRAGKEI